ncbi:MAG: hypothetical protein KDA53_16135 [Hyphomonas sp.]|nr:hypothetical protein [Hyphomonas sp.]
MNLAALSQTLAAFLKAKRRANRARDRQSLEALQARLLMAFLQGPAADVPAFAAFRGQPLAQWPVMDKAALMAGFEAYNRLGMTAAEGWAHLAAGTAPTGYSVGASTGTSGNRGLYIVSEAERYRWLGVMLARALPDVLRTRHRVAVVLPASSRLYDAANESGRLRLKFFDLARGIDAQFAPLAEFDPSVIVAPPKFLRALAESGTPVSPVRIFSGAEVLDDEDRRIIEARFGITLREIYMATEGLLGISCDKGMLHLLEDHIAFEFEPVDAERGLVTPLITDFSRRTQVMIRYRMNDILELSPEPCACGLPHQAVRRVHGRCDDIFELAGRDGSSVRVTPDVIRNAVVRADPSIHDFRVVRQDASNVRLILPLEAAGALEAARNGLAKLFGEAGAIVEVTASAETLLPPTDHKLRRVMAGKPAS